MAGWKMGFLLNDLDVFPIEHGDVPHSYVSLPEGIQTYFLFDSWTNLSAEFGGF